MPIQEDDVRTAYMQIADELRERIQRGEIKAGEKIPSTRKLAKEFKVAQYTAQKASKVLEAEGLVGGGPGRGFIVRSEPGKNPQEEVAAQAHQLASIQAQLKHMSARFDELKESTVQIDKVVELSARLEQLETAMAKLQKN